MKAPSKKARSLVLAPMSATAAELLHRLQQEAAEAVAPAPGTVMLPPQGALKLSSACDETYLSAYDAGHYNSITLIQSHGRQSQDKWIGTEVRHDTKGHRWERSFRAVVDDFGALVEVSL
jgi:hypothetical protein